MREMGFAISAGPVYRKRQQKQIDIKSYAQALKQTKHHDTVIRTQRVAFSGLSQFTSEVEN